MISAVILTFNSAQFLKPCLESLFKQDCADIEVIVVDNGSTDGTADFVKRYYPRIRLIENKKNLGACKARNQAIEASCGEWILTLDCDVVLAPDFIAAISDRLKNCSSGIGMVQPKILKADKQKIYSAGIFLSFFKRFYDIGQGKLDYRFVNKPSRIFGACAAAAVYRKKMLEEVRDAQGYFDERLFFLAEDVDLACRAQHKGWQALYCPQATCYHEGNSSLLRKDKRQYLCWRNRRLILQKFPQGVLVKALTQLSYDLPRDALLFLFNPYVRKAIKNKQAVEMS